MHQRPGALLLWDDLFTHAPDADLSRMIKTLADNAGEREELLKRALMKLVSATKEWLNALGRRGLQQSVSIPSEASRICARPDLSSAGFDREAGAAGNPDLRNVAPYGRPET